MADRSAVFALKFAVSVASIVFILGLLAAAQDSRPAPKSALPTASAPDSAPTPKSDQSSAQCSGMYAFLKEGEFVQLTVEDDGQVTGFVSRYGDEESADGAFLDQFFKSAKIDGRNLLFTTEVVHGVWFDFKGTVERGAGRNPGDEAYYVLKGELTENNTDINKKVTARSRNVILKMFPQEAVAGPAQANPSQKN